MIFIFNTNIYNTVEHKKKSNLIYDNEFKKEKKKLVFRIQCG